MPQYMCKMCGGNINIGCNMITVICDYCGSEQTITRVDNEKKLILFNRANEARLACDFEKALRNYETILIEYPNDAEAHWGICLCRYGIEYVDDPKTKKKIPTCHRTIYNSIFDDVDYQEVLKNCDIVSRKLYQEEAEKIDRIQKGILAISQKESPYDIFICYKETDSRGSRTKDSFIAEDIYTELINKQYKVFFSRITLESKLGLEYEPIIFSALQSSKIMLVIGSKKEHFEAVWVKNEWSRYLSFMAEQKGNKYMIPCYRDMEAYDMPDEFLALQSQNLDKLGAKQDIIRAIDKIFGKDKKVKNTNSIQNVTSEIGKYTNLLKRAALLIEDGEYSKADKILEKVLNNNPECAEAYAYKMLISMGLFKLSDLGKLEYPIDSDKNYEKAIRFADDKFKLTLESYNKEILDRINKEISLVYDEAQDLMSKGLKNNDILLLKRSIDLFEKIEYLVEYSCEDDSEYDDESDYDYNDEDDLFEYNFDDIRKYTGVDSISLKYSDITKQIAICFNAIENIRKESIYIEAVKFKEEKDYKNAINMFRRIPDYKESSKYINELDAIIDNIKKENTYIEYKAMIIKTSTYDDFNERDFNLALYNLKLISDYKDTKKIINDCEMMFNETKKRIQAEQALKYNKEIIHGIIYFLIFLAITILVIILFVVLSQIFFKDIF